MDILFATSELSPHVKVGGLGDAAAGLVKALRAAGDRVIVALPDYGGLELAETQRSALELPDWAGSARLRQGSLAGFDDVVLVGVAGMERSHPYTDSTGRGWPDNASRFFAFSAAVAGIAEGSRPDVLHLNDWHTGAALGFTDGSIASVLTIHNLAYQGVTTEEWLDRIPRRPEAYEWYGGTNPLTGAIALADRVVTVSPNFAREAVLPETGFGIDEALAARGRAFLGIMNGIDTEVWNPRTDPLLPLRYGPQTAWKKREIGRRLATGLGLEKGPGPLLGMVTRLTDQKGVDLALQLVPGLAELDARFVLLGSGDRALASLATRAATRFPGRFAFASAYDEPLAHLIFGGSDLYLMPSRFEPAGLTQMQAMRYGSIPVVTDVGGLHDTVIDADQTPGPGNGFVANTADVFSFGDALQRAVTAWRSPRRRGVIRRQGMTTDWSWDKSASEYRSLYAEITSPR